MSTKLAPDVDPRIISSDPEIVGGQPAFPGTRVMVYLLRDHLLAGGSINGFLKNCETVSRAQVLDVIELAFERIIGPIDD